MTLPGTDDEGTGNGMGPHEANGNEEVPLESLPLPGPSLDEQFRACLLNAPTKEAVRSLVAQGARLDMRMYGMSVLNATIYRKNLKAMVPVLLDLGADPLSLLDGETAFHAAAQMGDAISLRRLLAHSPQGVNALSNKGKTPLQVAMFKPDTPINYKAGVPTIVQVLLNAGADVNVGPNPVFHSLLGKRGLVPRPPVAWDQWFTAFLNAGLDPLSQNLQGETVLHRVVGQEHWLKFAQQLWAQGASMDACNGQGQSAWTKVRPAEAVAYRMAWNKHEQALLRTTVESTLDDTVLPAKTRSRL